MSTTQFKTIEPAWLKDEARVASTEMVEVRERLQAEGQWNENNPEYTKAFFKALADGAADPARHDMLAAQ